MNIVVLHQSPALVAADPVLACRAGDVLQ